MSKPVTNELRKPKVYTAPVKVQNLRPQAGKEKE